MPNSHGCALTMMPISGAPYWRQSVREKLSDASTIALLEHVGVGPGWHCWEAGAGLGSIANWLGTRVGAAGSVWATVRQPADLERLRWIRVPSLLATCHHLERDAFPSSMFDIFHARFVLEHVPTRDDVVRRAARSLKPGGWFVVEDADFDGCLLSPNARFATAMQGIAASADQRGSDFRWARSLAYVCQRAGLVDIQQSTTVRSFCGASEESAFWAANILEAVKSDGHYREVADCLDDLSRAEEHFCGPAVVSVTARRPITRADSRLDRPSE